MTQPHIGLYANQPTASAYLGLTTSLPRWSVRETPETHVLRRTLYLDTSVPSYLTARPSLDPKRARDQQITREWWELYRFHFDIHISELVVTEARRGHQDAVQRRLRVLSRFKMLGENEASRRLCRQLLQQCALPHRASNDAMHLSIAAVFRMSILLTWNCSHLANSTLFPRMKDICIKEGYACPRLCTPEDLTQER